MIDDLKAYIESVKDYLAQFQAKALVEVKQQARKSLAGYYQQAKQQQHLEDVVNAPNIKSVPSITVYVCQYRNFYNS